MVSASNRGVASGLWCVRTSASPCKPQLRFTPEERLQDMDEQGVDVQVVSIHTPLFSYDVASAQGQQLAREVNDEIAAMTRQWPQRFAGLATLPVQDVEAAVEELIVPSTSSASKVRSWTLWSMARLG